MKHRTKRRKTTSMKPPSKLLFVVRIQGWVKMLVHFLVYPAFVYQGYLLLLIVWASFSKKAIHPKLQKILKSLGLRRIFTGVFLKATEGTLAMLEKVEPYVTYGYGHDLISTTLICFDEYFCTIFAMLVIPCWYLYLLSSRHAEIYELYHTEIHRISCFGLTEKSYSFVDIASLVTWSPVYLSNFFFSFPLFHLDGSGYSFSDFCLMDSDDICQKPNTWMFLGHLKVSGC